MNFKEKEVIYARQTESFPNYDPQLELMEKRGIKKLGFLEQELAYGLQCGKYRASVGRPAKGLNVISTRGENGIFHDQGYEEKVAEDSFFGKMEEIRSGPTDQTGKRHFYRS